MNNIDTSIDKLVGVDSFELPEDDLQWLSLDESSFKDVANPFGLYNVGGLTKDPTEEILDIILRPDYLHFTARAILNVELLPYQLVILDILWNRRLPMVIGSRGAAKSYTLAVYCLLRMVLNQGCKIVIVGAGLRQSRQVFDYMATIWDKAPVLRDIAGRSKTAGPRREVDRFQFEIGESTCVAIPLGSGDKIRGLRANYIIADEFSCLEYNTLVETDLGLFRIGDCKDKKDINLYTGDKNLDKETPSNFIITPTTDVYKVTLEGGYSFGCSIDHKISTMNGWKKPLQLKKGEKIPFENHYKFPQKLVEKELTVDKNLGWLMGILTAEGSINSKHYLHVKMTDKDCIEKINDYWKQLDPNINTGICTIKSYKDKRGWINKESYTSYICNLKLRNKLVNLGLERKTAHNKIIPWSILCSPREVVVSFLEGLFEGDGTCFQYKEKSGRTNIGIALYSVSEQLISEVQVLLSKFDIFSCKIPRFSKLSNKIQWTLRTYSANSKRLLDLLKIKKWDKFRDIEIKGIDLTQRKNFLKVKSVELLPDQEHLYDFYLPETHSFYGNGFRQHNSIPEDIFNIVVQGFAVVSSDPVEKVKQAATIKKLKESGQWTDQMQAIHEEQGGANQIVYSGTAFYSFNHFYKRFKQWHSIISSKGSPKKLKELFGDDFTIAKGFRWQDYAIVRIPYTHVPEGMLDEGILAQGKATLSRSQFLMEFGAVFAADSEGFYKRSILEQATTNKPILINGKLIQFSALKSGSVDRVYIMGIDPAADQDNAAIVIIELNDNYRKVVHCWTTNKKKYGEYRKYMANRGSGQIDDEYYRYIARKIRSLMREFNIERIVMDKNGGGTAIAEALGSKDTCNSSESPVFIVTDPENPKADDMKEGIHILELVAPTQDLNVEANHGMLKDFQDKVLIFPKFDTVEIAKSIELDAMNSIQFDTYEDLVQEIEELKTEISTIVVTPSASLGKETFDTPKLKGVANQKGRLRKDRYSALLYANYYARNKNKDLALKIEYKVVGGTKDTVRMRTVQTTTGMYYGPGVLKVGTKNPWLTGGKQAYIKHN